MTWRILKYIQHLFYRRHRKGHGIHAPCLFEFVSEVVFNASEIEVPGKIIQVHRNLRKDRSLIPVGKLGATSNVNPSEVRSVRSFVRGSSVGEKYGALLFRISCWSKPDMIIELGTGLGVSTIYLSSGSPEIPLHTIEGNTDRADFAAQLMCKCNLGPVSIHWGEMEEKLEDLIPLIEGRILAYVDGNHCFEPTVSYIKKLISEAGEESVIVMDDIYWSKGMHRAWKEVVSWPEVRVSIDLFHMGILLLRNDLNRDQVKIKF